MDKKIDEENHENRKQLKYLKKLALEVPVVKPQDKNTENMKNLGLYAVERNIIENDDKKLFPRI